MIQLLQTIVLGLLIGGVYALMASGLTLVFGIMGIVNDGIHEPIITQGAARAQGGASKGPRALA